ncbi:unnamed protein product [Arabidopsis halleri]
MWVDGELFMTAEPPEVVKARNGNSVELTLSTLLGLSMAPQFLPRKFKVVVTVIGDIVLSDENEEPEGFNFYVGEGMGRIRRMEPTFSLPAVKAIVVHTAITREKR